MTITVTYTSIDWVRKAKIFKTLKGAQRFAHEWVGQHPEIGTGYAVSFDGVGKITVRGATLAELFPSDVPAPVAKSYRVVQDGMGYFTIYYGERLLTSVNTAVEAREYVESCQQDELDHGYERSPVEWLPKADDDLGPQPFEDTSYCPF